MVIKARKIPPTGIELLLEGRLDSVAAPSAQEAFTKVGNEYTQVSINMENLAYISSAGLRTLLILQKLMKKNGGTLKLNHVNAMVMEVFEMTGFGNVLDIE